MRRAARLLGDAMHAVATITLPEQLFTNFHQVPQFNAYLIWNFRAMGYMDSSGSITTSSLPKEKVRSY